MNADPASAGRADEGPIVAATPLETEGGVLRWAVLLLALALLLVGGYKAFEWIRLLAQPQPTPSSMAVTASAALPAPPRPASAPVVGRTLLTPQRPPLPPAVAGGPAPVQASAPATSSVRKCLLDGEVIYTNTECPAGALVEGADGLVQARPPRLGADPAQQLAHCQFLNAEIARLQYEFNQPLPPPVLDQIATRLRSQRSQASAAQCPAETSNAPQATASQPAPGRKRAPRVLEEKADDDTG